MPWLVDVLTVVYVVCAVALALYAAGTLALLVIWQRGRNRAVLTPPAAPGADCPIVLAQLPVYNERLVIGRLLEAVAGLDYPADRLRVQVLDDSSDDTPEVVARSLGTLKARGVPVEHIRRAERAGFKAGALAHGLARQPEAALVTVFDADFVPPPDFLRRVVPHFMADDRLGMVQTRWGHLNAGENALTRAQALSLDGHFVVEQTARSQGGLLLNFAGSAGVWRAACIQDAGGWSAATLAEDLDLSYRAQLRGWRCLYLPDVAVPAEIPPQLAAYRQQQARWAKGSTQNLLRHGAALWRNPAQSYARKIMGTLHLGQYLTHPLLLILVLLFPWLLATGALQRVPLAPFGLAGLAAPLVYGASQRQLYGDWPRRLLAFPVLMGVGTGLALSNSLAVLAALRGEPNEFRRTPKFDRVAWQRSGYALQRGGLLLGEALLAAYSVGSVYLALREVPSLAPFLAIYAYAFSLITIWGGVEALQVRRGRARRSAVHGQAAI